MQGEHQKIQSRKRGDSRRTAKYLLAFLSLNATNRQDTPDSACKQAESQEGRRIAWREDSRTCSELCTPQALAARALATCGAVAVDVDGHEVDK